MDTSRVVVVVAVVRRRVVVVVVVVGRSVVRVLWEDDVCVWSADLRDVIKQEQHVRGTSRGESEISIEDRHNSAWGLA